MDEYCSPSMIKLAKIVHSFHFSLETKNHPKIYFNCPADIVHSHYNIGTKPILVKIPEWSNSKILVSSENSLGIFFLKQNFQIFTTRPMFELLVLRLKELQSFLIDYGDSLDHQGCYSILDADIERTRAMTCFISFGETFCIGNISIQADSSNTFLGWCNYFITAGHKKIGYISSFSNQNRIALKAKKKNIDALIVDPSFNVQKRIVSQIKTFSSELEHFDRLISLPIIKLLPLGFVSTFYEIILHILSLHPKSTIYICTPNGKSLINLLNSSGKWLPDKFRTDIQDMIPQNTKNIHFYESLLDLTEIVSDAIIFCSIEEYLLILQSKDTSLYWKAAIKQYIGHHYEPETINSNACHSQGETNVKTQDKSQLDSPHIYKTDPSGFRSDFKKNAIETYKKPLTNTNKRLSKEQTELNNLGTPNKKPYIIKTDTTSSEEDFLMDTKETPREDPNLIRSDITSSEEKLRIVTKKTPNKKPHFTVPNKTISNQTAQRRKPNNIDKKRPSSNEKICAPLTQDNFHNQENEQNAEIKNKLYDSRNTDNLNETSNNGNSNTFLQGITFRDRPKSTPWTDQTFLDDKTEASKEDPPFLSEKELEYLQKIFKEIDPQQLNNFILNALQTVKIPQDTIISTEHIVLNINEIDFPADHKFYFSLFLNIRDLIEFYTPETVIHKEKGVIEELAIHYDKNIDHSLHSEIQKEKINEVSSGSTYKAVAPVYLTYKEVPPVYNNSKLENDYPFTYLINTDHLLFLEDTFFLHNCTMNNHVIRSSPINNADLLQSHFIELDKEFYHPHERKKIRVEGKHVWIEKY